MSITSFFAFLLAGEGFARFLGVLFLAADFGRPAMSVSRLMIWKTLTLNLEMRILVSGIACTLRLYIRRWSSTKISMATLVLPSMMMNNSDCLWFHQSMRPTVVDNVTEDRKSSSRSYHTQPSLVRELFWATKKVVYSCNDDND